VGDLQTAVGEEQKSKLVLPGALVKAKGKIAGVNLFKGTQQTGTDEEQLAALYNQVEVGLEYRFIEAIAKVTSNTKPGIAYAIGHGEPGEPLVTDMVSSLQGKNKETSFFNFGPFNLAKEPYVPETVSTLIINKPTKPFNDYDKLKIDQFIMRGGAVFWAIDNMYAEIDSLFRSGDQGFVAYDRALQLDDILFTYGARINQNLLQDLNADGLPIMTGDQESGSNSKIAPFSFMPILSGTNHPITKNIDGVRAVFPNTLDLVNGSNEIKKTVLLTSSPNAKIIGTPFKVDFSFMQYAQDKKQFTIKDTSVAALLEGKFKSHFQDRLPKAFSDSLTKYNRPFMEQATTPGKMIVVADGDIAMNGMNPVRGPLTMGENTYTRITYANKDFFMNCISYLSGNEKLLQSRAKNYTVRLLDPVKKENIGVWQFVTTVVPLILLVVIAFIFYIIRKKKYSTLN
jgi:gliding-associated putative ABC transporter substrate-binding component GldG